MNDSEIIKSYKYVLSGCRTIIDAYIFAEKFSIKHPHLYDIIYKLTNGKTYECVHDFTAMKKNIHNINETYNKTVTYKFVKHYTSTTSNVPQKKVFYKLTENKLYKN